MPLGLLCVFVEVRRVLVHLLDAVRLLAAGGKGAAAGAASQIGSRGKAHFSSRCGTPRFSPGAPMTFRPLFTVSCTPAINNSYTLGGKRSRRASHTFRLCAIGSPNA